MKKITYGIDNLLKNSKLKKKRWGLVTNDAVFTNDFIPLRQALLEKGFKIVRLFSPEHGINVMGTDGAKISHQTEY